MANKYTAYRYVSDTHKECSRCGEIKPHLDFHKDQGNKRGYGLAFYCKDCANSKSRNWHKHHTTDPIYRQARRDTYFKNKYDLTLSDYVYKLESQGNKCAICDTPLESSGVYTHLDHCHKTNKIRDFLCTNCNRGLGHFKDDISIMEKAITYLKEHTNEPT